MGGWSRRRRARRRTKKNKNSRRSSSSWLKKLVNKAKIVVKKHAKKLVKKGGLMKLLPKNLRGIARKWIAGDRKGAIMKAIDVIFRRFLRRRWMLGFLPVVKTIVNTFLSKKYKKKLFGPKFMDALFAAAAPTVRSAMAQIMDVDNVFCDPWRPILDSQFKELVSDSFGYAGSLSFPWRGPAKETPLYGNAAFEIYKQEWKTDGVGRTVSTGRIVCAARWDSNISICNTCCCKEGIVKRTVTGILLNDGCPPKNKLCGGKGKFNPMRYKFTAADAKKGHCSAWFTINDATIRLINGLMTAATLFRFHERGRSQLIPQDSLNPVGNTPGGTGCMVKH